jgi:glycosidase
MEKKRKNVFTIQLEKLNGRGTPGSIPRPLYNFHIRRDLRELYKIQEELFQTSGNVIFANFHQARILAQSMNERRDILRFPENAVKAGHLNAMGLIDEILHHVLHLYRKQEAPGVFAEAIGHLDNTVGEHEVDRLLETFIAIFPPPAVYKKEQSAADYLNNASEGVSNREIVLEEMLLLWISNQNPGFESYIELFDDTELKETTAYSSIMDELQTFFESRPAFGPKQQNIIEMLLSPGRSHRKSLSAQLSFIREQWGMLLGQYMLRLLQGTDFLKEEERPFFSGPGPSRVYEYSDEEIERFSKDLVWMPKVILLAKSTYVWLDQLSKKYGRPVFHLDHIPDEELDLIASRGFTALWLIGIWERSFASKRIKQLCGNPEAEASAYSLREYEIAEDLGGWDALHDLKKRCWRRGVRLASDMVPNHTGIDSKWVINHPDWFIQLSFPPFPRYTYSGENLSRDPRVAVYIEDHYYDKTDAAVTFKRLDTHTGDERYIYHGNDGTSMPWNDTAQINFLNPEAREAVIQTILHVARNFSVIRFDAAMTLAKKHFQRLWFPEPGAGGDIPSRAEHGMTKEAFNQAMPVEFWREVVDRIAREVPDTLLLAEAFWLMEGYFVRTLGMHRVYNSAFMNMLKNEENEKYRNTIKNTLEFDPNVLKRFVNFMNNPDEDTAIAQFGTGDKYFGVCTLLVTMPGLPMFGHGQVEGFTEKYGMEYRRAYWEEHENTALISRHEREIFPLLKLRHIFADVDNFLLYDLYGGDGHVNENVFVYSNRVGDEKALVIYNNSYARAGGWINMSAAFAVKDETGNKQLTRKNLAQGLNLPAGDTSFIIFQEQGSKLWFIRNCRQLWNQGLYAELEGYACHVFLNFYAVFDDEYGHYRQLENKLNGSGSPDIDTSLREIFMEPLHAVFSLALDRDTITMLTEAFNGKRGLAVGYVEDCRDRYTAFLNKAVDFYPDGEDVTRKDIENAGDAFTEQIEAYLKLGQMLRSASKEEPYIKAHLGTDESGACLLLLWQYTIPLTVIAGGDPTLIRETDSVSEQLLLEIPMKEAAAALFQPKTSSAVIRRQRILSLLQGELAGMDCSVTADFIKTSLKHSEISSYIQENRYNGILYFHKESFEAFMWLVFLGKTFLITKGVNEEKKVKKAFSSLSGSVEAVLDAAEESGYRLEKMLELIEEPSRR